MKYTQLRFHFGRKCLAIRHRLLTEFFPPIESARQESNRAHGSLERATSWFAVAATYSQFSNIADRYNFAVLEHSWLVQGGHLSIRTGSPWESSSSCTL